MFPISFTKDWGKPNLQTGFWTAQFKLYSENKSVDLSWKLWPWGTTEVEHVHNIEKKKQPWLLRDRLADRFELHTLFFHRYYQGFNSIVFGSDLSFLKNTQKRFRKWRKSWIWCKVSIFWDNFAPSHHEYKNTLGLFLGHTVWLEVWLQIGSYRYYLRISQTLLPECLETAISKINLMYWSRNQT